MKRKISSSLILISVLGIFIIISINCFLKLKNEEIVNQMKIGEYTVKNYYVGYIEICSLEIPLVYGTTSRELNQNLVGIDNHSTKEHLILAGHAIETVFLCLYDITLNSEITIFFNNSKLNYIIDNKKQVINTDISIYKNTGLTLITCLDKKRRLIVHAKTAN